MHESYSTWFVHLSVCLQKEVAVSQSRQTLYVGIARTHNIWQYKKNSKNLKNGQLISLYSNIHSSLSVFMTNKTPSGARKHHESTKPGTRKRGKMFFFLLSLDGLAQYCVNLSRWFTHETAAFYTEQCITPSLFHNFEVSQGACNHHPKTMASSLRCHFLSSFIRMRT